MAAPQEHVDAALRDSTRNGTDVGHLTVQEVSQLEHRDATGRHWTTTALVSISPTDGEPFCAILAWDSDGENAGAAAEGDPLEADGCEWVLQRPQQGLLEKYSGCEGLYPPSS